MFIVFSPVIVAGIKLISRYDFVAPLKISHNSGLQLY